MIDYQSLLKKL